ncbi:hemagglutinin repeat-containing protein [Pseudomonas cucumis]|uniref:hemagglutinin repeat-containing protein n=1 Tax=Pseudomonas cucumis TaxID=2954082 RepID=UPI00273778C9|nr:hemagglutinin repeat-containing protein [Pseudomonas cucumis]WLG89155.1 hemagglutinin repeat-containing protein [Pseudomonas cucumis]
MDVRHYAFLAGQPSAAVKNREHFWGMPKRGLAFLLANVMFWQPMWAQADGIVVASPGTSLGQAGNGVPIVQIATPNGTGLSHNQFHDYNVGAQGVILNNVANQTGATQLGGIIVGNPNLTNRVAAQTILNEVVGGSPSQLRGYTEVAGQSARVIVANPYGISCNGCGFINTPRVTLTTGKPVLDNGRLDRFQVDQGSVSIDGAGLNASNVDRFEIITRSAKINAEIQARNLTIVAGRNDVNADSLNATARADDGSGKPGLAIDSSALGGMYAGAIKLVGTEAGVGVKLDGKLIASGGDIQLDANGHLSLVDTSATNGAVNVKAASLDARGPVYAGTALNVQTQGNLTNQQTFAARDSITLSAGGVLTNNGVIEAGVNADTSRNATGDVSLSAQNFNNTGKTVVASRNLTVNTSQTLSNQNGTLSAAQTANITAGTLDNQNNGRVLSKGNLNLTANQVLNSNGLINSTGNLTGTVGRLNNSNGELTSLANATLNMTSLDNVAGLVMAGRLLDITASGAINNIGGTLGGKNALTVRAQNLDNSQQGELSSEGQLSTRVSGLLNNQNKGLIQANGAMDVQATRLDNREGKISGINTLTVSSNNADNRNGVIRADQTLKLLVTELDNSAKGRLESKAALTFDGNKLDNRNGGLLTASGLISLKAKEVANDAGRISGKGDVEANIDALSQQAGELVAEGNLKLTGKTLDNRKDGLVASLKSLTVSVDQIDNRGGSLSSQTDLHINGASLNNSDSGKVLSDTTLALKVDQIINQTAGLIFSKGASTLSGIGLNNVAGKIVSQNSLVLTFDDVMDNQQGLISSEGTLTLTAGTLDNRLGKLSSLEAMALTTTAALQNQGGLIASQKGLTLVSGSLDNSDKGVISAKAASTVTTGAFNNSRGGSLATDGTLDLTAKHLDNSAGQIGSQQQLNVSVTSLDQDGGELFSNSDLTLDLNNGLLNNQRGNIHTPGLLLLKNLKEVSNSGGEISGAKAYNLTAQSLNNDGGKLLSNEKLTLVIDRALSNVKGLIASASLDSHSASLNNAGGEIRGRGEVDLTVTDAFDNQAGVVIADDGLTVKAASLDNRQEGLVGATKALKLTVDDIDNRNGELSSKADVTLIGQQLDNSDAGYILAGGNLALTVDKVINRNKGLLSGDTGLTLTGKTLENSGRLTTLNNLTVNLTSDLDNNQGSLVSEGKLAIDAQSLSNNGGTISSAKALTVDSKGAVSNQGGKLLTDTTLTLTSTRLENQQKGVISSKGGMSITTGALNNSQASIYAGDNLELSAGQVTNTGGSIGAATSLVADVSGLDQQGGKLFSKGTLSLDVNGGALNNQDGFINSPGQLLLKNLADVNNRNGEISSEEAFDLVAKQLDNSDGGRLLSNQKLTLHIDNALTSIKGKIAAAALQVRAASLDSSAGTLLSDGDLEVTVDGLLTNQNKGVIKAAGQLTLNSNGLDNQGGTLLGGTGLSIDLGATPVDLNNQNGLINTKGVLSIAHLRDLNNQQGEISSVHSFSLIGNTLDNRGGHLISNDQLTLNATRLNNQGGLISGWNKLTVAGGSLDNSLEGTLSSLFGNLNIDLSGALINNTKGGLAGKGDVTITATSLDNSNGIVTSGGKQTLTMTQGAINNTSGGLIESSGTLDISAASLNNASGNVTANKALTFTGTSLDNSNGSLVGEDSVTLDLLGALTNIKGELGSTGPLVIKRSSSIDNQGGQLISQGLLSLLTGNLNNSQEGTVAANGQLDLTATGSVRNDAAGLISSRDAGINLKAASLNNAGGALQSLDALTLDVKGGAIDNQGGKVIAQNGELNITAASLDSRAGVLSSLKGLLQTRLTGVLRNGQGGKIEGNRLDLQALGGIYSDGGRIAANTGNILLNAGGAAIDNSNGGIYAKGLVKVVGGSLNNNAGKISGDGIDVVLDSNLTNRGGLIESAGPLAVRAASVDNQSGKLRALGVGGKTNFQIGSLFDNRNGLVETANTDLTLATPSFLNAGGTVTHVGAGEFDISTANVMNAGGSLATRGGLTLNADSWTNSSVIQAGRLKVNVNNFVQTASGQLLASNHLEGRGVNWTNNGLIASDGSLDLQLSGGYKGDGRVSSLGNLGLTAGQLDLSMASTIASGGDARIDVGGQLNNHGRLTSSANMQVQAGGVSNFGTLGSGQNLTIKTPTLLNERGLIFSGKDMGLLVNDFTNQNGSLFSLANLNIAGVNGGQANNVRNLASTITIDGDLTLAANVFLNKTEGVLGKEKLVSGDITYECQGGECKWVNYYIEEHYESESTTTGESAVISVAGNISATVGEFTNFASVISAGKNIKLDVGSFDNTALDSGSYTKTLIYNARVRDLMGLVDEDTGPITAYARRNSKYIHQYSDYGCFGQDWQGCGPVAIPRSSQTTTTLNPDFGIGAEVAVPARIFGYDFKGGDTVFTSKGGAPSIVQAGQALEVNAKTTLKNGSLQAYTAFTGVAKNSPDTGVNRGATIPVIRINAQLPPDLAQQQVNPLTLPGFTLPTGDNGLFRLSGKGTEQTMVPGQSWTIGSVTAATTQRSDGMPVRQATELQFDKNDPVSVKKRELALASRPSVNLNDKTAQVNVNAAAGDGPIGVLLPGSPSFNVPRVQGLPDTSVRSNPHKYLIETNPVLTNLKQFMSSDYLLANLGYDPDTSAKRLGDGLFEQRLVQQAIVARTGQRFIDGQTSDEAMFKYLMNNAIASKDQLNLSMGVTLTSQQVAALTHDIVWLEEHVVNGEKVLVPVLYLAQANNRLAPNGALIQGGDVTLIAGQDLNNAGTLRATNNLSAEAGNDLTNSGLIEAGDRLTLKAGNNIVNKSGGIISGRDVSLTATNGDVINQRDVTGVDVRRGGSLQHRDYLDNAARIEAANDLSINAGRDINNIGGVLQSGRDLELDAVRDVNITSVQDRSTNARGSHFLNQTITQHAAEVTSGRDLSISADRDVAIVASRLDAKRDISVNAGNDIIITSAANESDYVSRSKKRAQETHSTTQQASVLNAGRDIALYAGNDLGIIASRIKASENIDLDAVQDITVASAKDESSSFYYKKKKGSFGRSSTTQKESYDSTNVASVIEAGNDLTVNATKDEDGAVSLDGGRNVTIIGSQLKARNDLVVGATNDVAVLSGTEETGAYSKKTKTGLFGMSSSGKSHLQTTVSQVASELNGTRDVVVIAGRNVGVHASEINAGNDAELHAGLVDKTGDINLAAADDQAYSRAEEYKKKVGLSLKDAVGWAVGTPSFGADMTFSSAQKGGREVVSSTSVGSLVNAGHDAILNAARDINIVGSGVSAYHTAQLDAGRDVNVLADTDTQRSTSWESNKSFGIKQDVDNNGYTTFVGSETLKHGVDSNGRTAAGSFIDAGEDLKINAGRDINQQGSDLQAENDIKLKATRDINIDAADQFSEVTTQDSVKRNGTTTTVAYNYGKTMDTLNGTGKGEDGVSKGSSTLKSVDALDQFFSGPKADGHWGASSSSQSQTRTSLTNRPSTFSAGNDISMEAGNDVNVKGSQFNAGRDINVTGKNITFDVAHGAEGSDGNQTQSKGGLKGGTSGGFKIGVGISNAGSKDESNQGTSTPTQLNAGGSINLDAKNDLNLIGTQVTAERDIKLKATNDINIHAAQNDSTSDSSRRSWGAEGGITLSRDGFGIYGSIDLGLGNLDREGVKQQDAYLYAGNNLSFESGRDTNIAGAQLRGDEVNGKVGRNLTVTSLPDTGKVSGQELDISATGSFVGVSGSLGYGKTTGKTNWVESQTVISGKNKVDIRTENHTQLDGAVVSADNGNLKLDTDTLGFRDIAGKDKEHAYYLNVSGGYNFDSTKDSNKKDDKSQGSGAIEGYNYTKDREQTLRATVGAGDIVVRHDRTTGEDSTTGLNRDPARAYEITRDEEHRTDLYVSSSSVKSVLEPITTITRWGNGVINYSDTAKANFNEVALVIGNQIDRMQFEGVGKGAVAAGGEEIAEQALSALVEAGYSRKDARAMLEDSKFQSQVLAQLKQLDDLSKEQSEKVAAVKADLLNKGEKIIDVKGPPITNAKLALDRVSDINKYLKENPDKVQAVELILAASQGPKGMIMYAAQKVLGDISFIQSLDVLRSELEAKVGRQIAEGIEGPTLYKNSQYTDWRLGGGSLMASVLLGLGTPSLGKTGDRYVTVNQVERPHTGGGGPDKTPDRPIDPKKPHVPLRVVEIDSGGKGAWNKELNKPQPNTIYKVDGNKVYQTDSLGRVEKVEADLSGIVRDRNKYQQCQTGKCGLDADEGGHLIASIMDGPGERINMVPMDGNLNKGAWKKMENIWAKAVDEGKSVKVEIQPVYGGAGVRPDSFVVTYRIGNKQEVREAYVNAPGGK